jgi:hypothetical protein
VVSGACPLLQCNYVALQQRLVRSGCAGCCSHKQFVAVAIATTNVGVPVPPSTVKQDRATARNYMQLQELNIKSRKHISLARQL